MTLLGIALLTPLAVRWLLAQWPGVRYVELLAYDWRVRALPRQAADPRIVIIGMDDATLDALPLGARPFYPLPRFLHAHLVDELREGGARAVGFDVMFTRDGGPGDAPFAAALRRFASRSLTGRRFAKQRPQTRERNEQAGGARASGKAVAALLPETRIENGEETFRFTPSAPLLRPHLVESSILVQRHWGIARWFLPLPADEQTTRRYPHFAVAMAASYFGEMGREPIIGRSFRLGRIVAPLGGAGEICIRYAGPPGTFRVVPYHEVWSGAWKRTRGPDFFRNKIVLIGLVNRLEDRQDTPLGQMQGVEILAHATQTVLRGAWLRHWSEAATYSVAMALCLTLAAVWGLGGQRRALVAGVLLALLWIVTSRWFFISRSVWADMVEPLLALAATFIAIATFEAQRMRRVFRRFMPAGVAEQMLASDAGASTQTIEREATIVFCDVRDSTALAERLPPEMFEELLRQYFTAGEEAALHFGTELDKFVGDEMMLWFEERRGYEPHAVRAVRWAMTMQEAAARLDASSLAGKTGFTIGIGICSGVVRVGTVGARRRIQHTVIGDAVNTASRLQDATKEVGCGIILSQSTRDRVAEYLPLEPMGEVRVKGKREPLPIYCPS